MAGLGVIVLLMGLGSLYSSRRIWLLISLVNNLALLLFFKYARFVVENLNAVLAWLHISAHVVGPVRADALWFPLPAAGRHLVLHLPIAELHHRFLPGQDGPGTEFPALRHLRLLLSAVDGRPHRARPASAPAVPPVPARPPAELHRRRVAVPGRACSRNWPWPIICRSTSIGCMTTRRPSARPA